MLNVVVVGMGPIGIGAAKAVLADPGMELVGLVDIDPAKVGKRVPELEGGPVVTPTLKQAVAGGAAVAIVTTTSKLDRMAGTLREAMSLELHVVGRCEGMVVPADRAPGLAGGQGAGAEGGGGAAFGGG